MEGDIVSVSVPAVGVEVRAGRDLDGCLRSAERLVAPRHAEFRRSRRDKRSTRIGLVCLRRNERARADRLEAEVSGQDDRLVLEREAGRRVDFKDAGVHRVRRRVRDRADVRRDVHAVEAFERQALPAKVDSGAVRDLRDVESAPVPV